MSYVIQKYATTSLHSVIAFIACSNDGALYWNASVDEAIQFGRYEDAARFLKFIYKDDVYKHLMATGCIDGHPTSRIDMYVVRTASLNVERNLTAKEEFELPVSQQSLREEDPISTPGDNPRHVLHITCGEPGWVPSKDELNEIKASFEKVYDFNTKIVVTRTGVIVSSVME